MKSKSMLFVFPSIVLAFIVAAIIHGCVNDSDKPYRGSMEVLVNPPLVGDTYEGPHTHENANAVFWNKKMYLFYPTQDPDNEIHYQIYDGSSYDGGYTLKIDGDVQNTSAQMTPIVVNKMMYLFFTGHDSGYLDYTYLDIKTGTWASPQRIKNGSSSQSTNTDLRYSAVFNTQKQCIEVYWLPSGTTKIKYASINVDKDGYTSGSWSGFANLPGAENTEVDGHLSAVYYQTGDTTGVTYLAYRGKSDSKAHIAHINNFSVQSTDSNSSWSISSKDCGPSLADLGEDKMAMIWLKGEGDDVYYLYYDKLNSRWDDYSNKKTVDVDTNDWVPNGAIFYEEVPDSASPTGKRYDATFSIIYGHWKDGSMKSSSVWKVKEAEYIGYWWPTAKPIVTDLAGDSDTYKKTFHLWPMMLLIDAPPFVANGTSGVYDCNHSEQHFSCTETKFNYSKSNGVLVGGELRGGPYVETGKKSPVTVQMSMGLSGSLEKGTEYKCSSTDSLSQSPEGLVLGIYLAPVLEATKLEWYKQATPSATATGIYTYPIRVTGYSYQKETFNPVTGPMSDGTPYDNLPSPYLNIPNHASENDTERLETYKYVDGYFDSYTKIAEVSSKQWVEDSPNTSELEITQEGSSTVGGYIELKMGVELMEKILGVGVEGSFEIYQTMSYTQSTIVETTLENPDPASGQIKKIDVESYFLKPDINGYWVPQNSNQIGGAPAFVTYRVKSYLYK